MTRHLRPSLCCALVSWAQAAAAAPDEPPTDAVDLSGVQDVTELDLASLLEVEIVTASRRAQRATDAPATVQVLTRADIEARGYHDLVDVLRDLPGMQVDELYFSELGTQVPIRGVAGNNKIVLLVNGMRVNPPGGEWVPLRSDFSVRGAQQIEVIYGPGSTLYGQDAISAVINVITEPVAADDADVEVLGDAGTRAYKEGYGAARVPIGEVGGQEVRLSTYAQVVEGRLTDYAEQYPEYWQARLEGAGELQGVQVPVRRDLGANAFARVETDTASVQAWYRESRRSSAEGGYPVLQFVEGAVWRDRSLAVEARHLFELSDRVGLHSSLTLNRYQIDDETQYVFPIETPTGAERSDFDYKYGLGTSETVEERLQADVTDELSIQGGLVASFYDVTPKLTVLGGANPNQDIVSQAGTLTYYTTQGDPDSAVTVAKASNLNYQGYAAYVEGQYRPVPQFEVVAGLRLDLNTRFDDLPLSPRVALIAKPVEALSAKYIFTRAFVAPAPYFGSAIYDSGVAVNIANPRLEPETAMSNEINLTYTTADVLVGASAYYNTQDNLVIPGDVIGPPTVVQDQVWLDEAGTLERVLTHGANAGGSRAVGGELYGRWRAGERMSGWASVSVVDFVSEFAGAESHNVGISQVNGRLGVSLAPVDGLTLTPSGWIRSTPEGAPELMPQLADATRTPYQLDLHVGWRPIEQLEVFATGHNLTDHRGASGGLLVPVPQETLWMDGGLRLSL